MSATATGMLIFGLLDLERHVDIDALGFNLMGGMGANIVGGLLVGAGMTITGACPGTNIVQIGAGVPNAIYTYFGQIVGALLFGVSFYYIQTVLPAYKRKRPALLLDRYFGMNFLTVSLMIASLIGFSLYLLEGYETYRKESLRYSRVLSYITSNKTYLQMVHWHPVVCGVLIGILQLFLTKYAGIQLGNSAQYVWLSSGIGKLILPQKAASFSIRFSMKHTSNPRLSRLLHFLRLFKVSDVCLELTLAHIKPTFQSCRKHPMLLPFNVFLVE